MNSEIDRKIAVIFVADVVGYSKHMEKDENATIKSYNACEKILNKLLKKYKGSVFNTAGDSVLAEFPSAVNAVECGVDFQNEIKKRNQSDKTDVKLEFRLGINMGDVVKKEGNLIGDGVNIAARLEALSQPNGITISKSVYDFVVPKTKMTFNDLGVQKVKQNEFHAFDILLDPSQKRTLKTKPKSNMPLIGAIATVVIIAFVGVFYFNTSGDPENSVMITNEEKQKVIGRTLLILPFETNGDKQFDYVAKGITDHLRSELSNTVLLNILSKNQSFEIKNSNFTIKELKSNFDISYLISGSVLVVGDKFRVSFELLDIHQNKVLLSSNKEFPISSVFKAQDETEDLIRLEIQSSITMGKTLSDEYLESFEDKSDYKMALALRVKENSDKFIESIEDVERGYRELYDKNAQNSMAAYLLARTIFYKIHFKQSENRKKDAIEINKILDEALSRSPDNASILALKAFFVEAFSFFIGVTPQEARVFGKETIKKAVKIGSDNSNTLFRSGVYYAIIGNSKQAITLLEKAIRIAPFGPEKIRRFLCRTYIEGFDYESAEKSALELINFSDKRSVFLGTVFLTHIKLKMNKPKEASDILSKYLRDNNLSKKHVLEELFLIKGNDDFYQIIRGDIAALELS